jgi:thiosulfate reductase cytochrome b subunit
MPTRIEKKHPLAIRWFHWINFPALCIMIWSGMLIYWANDIYRIGYGRHTLFHFFPDWFYRPELHGLRVAAAGDNGHPLYALDHRLAEGMAWHFLFMWLFVINGLLYVAYTAVSGEWRYLLPNRRSFAEAVQVVLHDLHLRHAPLPRRKFNGAQQIAYTMIIVMGAGSALTGLSIYRPVQFGWLTVLFGGYMMARFIHFWLTIGYCVFFVVHVTQVVRAGWSNFRAMITGHELVTTEVAPSDVPVSPAPEAAP